MDHDSNRATESGEETSPGEAEDYHLRRGTPEFRRANLALFIAGLATFAMLYCTQPLLPIFSSAFDLTPLVASLSLSVSTATLAVALLVTGSLSEAWGRTSMMTVSLALSSLLMVLAAFSPSFALLLVVRAVQGVTLAGIPAVAIAYLAEEVDAKHMGFTVGMYIAGNSRWRPGGTYLSQRSHRRLLMALGVRCPGVRECAHKPHLLAAPA